MGLSSDLISQFIRATNDSAEKPKELTAYGMIVEVGGVSYVKLDGSELLTPISRTTVTKDNDRVMVTVKNHTAVVTGNLTSPSASDADVKELGGKVGEFHTIIAQKADVDALEAEIARINELVADNATIKGKLEASEADISELKADNVVIKETLTANDASIKHLEAEKLDANAADLKYATVENLNATNTDVHNLDATFANFEKTTTDTLKANEASIKELETGKLSADAADLKYATIENLNAANANISNLETEKLSAEEADLKYATIENLNAANANISNLETTKLSAKDAEITYANVDFSNIGKAAMEYFYANSGLIRNVTIGDATIAGELVGVTIKGDLIEGNTIVAEKLVIKGEDGLYYKLNTDGVTTEAEQTDYNSLSGTVIQAKSITAEKINVTDLVAFDATIGGFNLTENAIYSGVKDSVDNTTRGIYMDNDGQVAIGDASNYLKYYRDTDGSYKLAISAKSVTLSVGNKTVEEAINDMQDKYDSLKDEVSTILRVESSRGTVFKNDTVPTVLSAVIYRGSMRITEIDTLREVMGAGVYLQWRCQRNNSDSYEILSAEDSRIGNDGFTFTLNPNEVDTKVTFMCELIA